MAQSLMDVYEGLTVIIQAGTVGSVDFTQQPAIGTEFLDGCTVIMIACPTKAIMAHIPHLPPSPTMATITRSLVNLEGTMAALRGLYANLKIDTDGSLHFRAQDTKTIILAGANSEDELQETHHITMVSSQLKGMGLVPEITPYTFNPSPDADTTAMLINMDFGDAQEMPQMHLGGAHFEW